ncbi:MAG TPA: biotin/lipoyl-containing protein [Streptosporangiaceae bacterium]|nr:biotin/lipoyl-containing protein [Streptosporangiaceae bacterium]
MADQADPSGADTVETTERTLRVIRSIATEMLLELPRPPRGLRLRAGEVCLELEWSEPGQPSQAGPAVPQLSPNGHKGEAPLLDFVAPSAKAEPERSGAAVCAPMVGVFYRAPQPGAAPFVTEGDFITPGQQVAIIEAMKLMIPVEAELSGRIASVLVPDGESVEYGQPLFAVDEDSS